MIQLIVSDVDGTLLINNRTSQADISALRWAADAGIKICLASGRTLNELQAYAHEVGIEPHYYISQNGALLHTREGSLLESSSFSADVASRLWTHAKGLELAYTISCIDGHIYVPISHHFQRMKDRMLSPIVATSDPMSLFNCGILPCKFAFFGDPGDLNELQGTIESSLFGQVGTFLSSKDCLDVMPVNVSKGNALRVLLKHLDILPENAMCIGDAFNDLSMFESVRYSFAMEHSNSIVQEAAYRAVGSVADAVNWAKSNQVQ